MLNQNKVKLMSQNSAISIHQPSEPDFRDPDLQLITSSRILTLKDVSQMHLDCAKEFILHRMIFRKKFTELLKVVKSGIIRPDQFN